MLIVALALGFTLSVIVFDGYPGEQTTYDVAAAVSSVLVFLLAFLSWREAPRWLHVLQLVACALALGPLLWATREITGIF
jgi:hypothetical protein